MRQRAPLVNQDTALGGGYNRPPHQTIYGRLLGHGKRISGEFEQVSNGGGTQPRWRRDGKELFYLGADNKISVADIAERGVGLEVANARALFPARATVMTPQGYIYDVSADGNKFIVIVEPQQTTAEPLTLVVNWTADLKR